ncbi:bifunctional tetrahydrofolate synthase/dihydrofolate synthase [Pseudoalteromonas tunicata]|uniref:bifunctional tetrahydrofolate synthase/dihydrofolate synthase n=1 Tax=Pseudoalteromonas tunicata TaxID=314281 RepID=UPI00273E15E9|nr:bifunctional tetrahydrofolate synthase/dihydrofolate synthase [Pseudoalteromonas tunicata]MDP4985132.1 bifunctional tetrahydrofolate synthase/dihydrofolate synthase [Pseudoalteromonas tunicata]
MTQYIPSQSSSLDDWLCYLEGIHPTNIEMGLTRVTAVAEKMGLLSLKSKIILIAGTNGKGTTARCLEALLLAQNFTVGTYASPHLIKYNERVRLNGQQLDDHYHVAAFAALEKGRGDISMTYFEFGTLGALEIFRHTEPDFILLEVGLGGRLDATNIVTPIASVITTIDLDHKEYLGDTRELVGFEKAGIFRGVTPAIVGDLAIPASILNHGKAIGANLCLAQQDFNLSQNESGYLWQSGDNKIRFSQPAIPAQNVSTALATLNQLGLLPTESVVQAQLSRLKVEGRFEILSQAPFVVVDVAHNPESAAYLALKLNAYKEQGYQINALVGMLKDKDQPAALKHLIPIVDGWRVATLTGPRGADADFMAQILTELGVQTLQKFASVAIALDNEQITTNKQLLIVFGSFYTVADAISYWRNKEEA